MEYIPLCPWDVLYGHRQRTLTIAEKKFVSRQHLEGLCYLKTQSVLHLDLKRKFINMKLKFNPNLPWIASNLMLTAAGQLKIIDFGFAETDSNMGAPLLKMSAPYRPPEVWFNTTGKPLYGFHSDLWSAG